MQISLNGQSVSSKTRNKLTTKMLHIKYIFDTDLNLSLQINSIQLSSAQFSSESLVFVSHGTA